MRDFEDHDVVKVQAGRRSRPAHPSASPYTRPPLSAISDEAAALHYEQFKHGTVSIETDVAVYILKIGPEHADQMSDVAAHERRTRAAC
jgi:hypothetical protein